MRCDRLLSSVVRGQTIASLACRVLPWSILALQVGSRLSKENENLISELADLFDIIGMHGGLPLLLLQLSHLRQSYRQRLQLVFILLQDTDVRGGQRRLLLPREHAVPK